MSNKILPQGYLRFSFICDNPHACKMDIRKHGSAEISIEKYKQIMDIIYGKD